MISRRAELGRTVLIATAAGVVVLAGLRYPVVPMDIQAMHLLFGALALGAAALAAVRPQWLRLAGHGRGIAVALAVLGALAIAGSTWPYAVCEGRGRLLSADTSLAGASHFELMAGGGELAIRWIPTDVVRMQHEALSGSVTAYRLRELEDALTGARSIDDFERRLRAAGWSGLRRSCT